jgi:NADH dehydrogenase FAD-containing subunit
MLHHDIDLVVGDVVGIDPDKKLVDIATKTGPHVEGYDTLIYAVGSVAAIGVPGAEEFAYLLANPDGAQAAHDRIANIQPGQKVVVVGGGATGVEAAAEIAEQHPDAQVALLCADNLLGFMPARARASISRTLARLGVQVHEHARVARVLEHAVELADRTPVPSDVTVWAASFSVPQLAATSGLPVDEIGRLRVDEYLRSIDYPDIIGAGDAVRPPASVGAHLRMSCAMALPSVGTPPTPPSRNCGQPNPSPYRPASSCSASASAGAKDTFSSCTPTTLPADSTSPVHWARKSRK